MRDEVEIALSLIAGERGAALLAATEDQWFDRKSAKIKARDLAPILVGFANAEGGTVVIGLHEGTVEGVAQWGSKENEWRQAAADYTVPPVRMVAEQVDCATSSGQSDRLLVLRVAQSDRLHATHRDEVFLRIGDETRRLSYVQRREL